MFFSKCKSKYTVSLRVHFRKNPIRPDVDLRKVEKLDSEEHFGWAPYCDLLWPIRSTATTLVMDIDAELKPLWQVTVADLKAALHAQRKLLKVPSLIDLNEIDTRFVARYETRYIEYFVYASFEQFVDNIAMDLFGEVVFMNSFMPSTVVKEQKGRVPNGRRQLKAEYIECFEFLCDYYGGMFIDNSQSGHVHWRQDLRNIYNGCVTRRRKVATGYAHQKPIFWDVEIFE
uniref:MRG domain-containing protein n=1 Tax=Panagrellus redivivus TaxID=6233 RepID=A0A7E4W2F3_PANRE